MDKVFLRKDCWKKVIFNPRELTKEIREVFAYPYKKYKLTEKQFNYEVQRYKQDKNYKDIH